MNSRPSRTTAKMQFRQGDEVVRCARLPIVMLAAEHDGAVRVGEAAFQDQAELVAAVAVAREARARRHADQAGVGAGELRAGHEVDERDAARRSRRPGPRVDRQLEQRAGALAAHVEEAGHLIGERRQPPALAAAATALALLTIDASGRGDAVALGGGGSASASRDSASWADAARRAAEAGNRCAVDSARGAHRECRDSYGIQRRWSFMRAPPARCRVEPARNVARRGHARKPCRSARGATQFRRAQPLEVAQIEHARARRAGARERGAPGPCRRQRGSSTVTVAPEPGALPCSTKALRWPACAAAVRRGGVAGHARHRAAGRS